MYFAHSAKPTTDLTTVLINYINAGGCVIYGSEDNSKDDVNILMNGIFGMSPAINQIGSGSDDVYMINNNLKDDPIINGPFGNVAGGYWGEDNVSDNSIVMTELPPYSVQICPANSEKKKNTHHPATSIVWYNNAKNFVYFGDSVGSSSNNSSDNAYPSIYSTQGMPKTKIYGPGSTYNEYVYNSTLELNAVAWALKKAAIAGINGR